MKAEADDRVAQRWHMNMAPAQCEQIESLHVAGISGYLGL